MVRVIGGRNTRTVRGFDCFDPESKLTTASVIVSFFPVARLELGSDQGAKEEAASCQEL